MPSTAVEQLERRAAAVRLDPRFQANQGERKVFLAKSARHSHHSMEPVKPAAGGRQLLEQATRRVAMQETRTHEPLPTRAAAGHSLLTATLDLSQKLDILSAQLAAASSDVQHDEDTGVDALPNRHMLSELSRSLARHAALSREALEREREARARELEQRNVELAAARDELSKQQESEAERISAAIEAERRKWQAEAAAQLADALCAADARATDEIEQLTARHARELDALHARLRRLELQPGAGP